ncbi:MAG: glycosyltransferase, partial [Sinomicrobium sp.]|nr:glycosyltransferase [Sinomicrobium sp.]
MDPVRISVILSTYNQPAWLEKVLWGYHAQQFRDFEVIIADDGSGETTATLIKAMRETVSCPVVHVWQEDNGFRKNTILNKAIAASNGAYIVVSDGDCIPRSDFLSVHDRYSEAGCFLSGGYFKLPMDISTAITKDDILTGRCFNLKWLKERGLKPSFRNNKLTSRGFKARLLNTLTPTTATWNGHNASGWK